MYFFVCAFRSGGHGVIFFMLNSTEHEKNMLKNVKKQTIVGILTFISMVNATSESSKAKILLFFSILIFIRS